MTILHILNKKSIKSKARNVQKLQTDCLSADISSLIKVIKVLQSKSKSSNFYYLSPKISY